MHEIKNYDFAANRFYSELSIKNLPINSWDLHAMHFDEICKTSRDIFQLKNLSKINKWSHKKDFEKQLFQKDHIIVVTDAQLKIVHATQNILNMNGYHPDEIVGKKPKMFQGADTCEETSRIIRKAVMNREPFEAIILNYRKDGSTYNCWIKGEPVLNKSGELVNFIAYEKEVA